MCVLAKITIVGVLAGILIGGAAAAETAPPKETPAAEKKAEQTPPGKTKIKTKGKKKIVTEADCDFRGMAIGGTTFGKKAADSKPPIPASAPDDCFRNYTGLTHYDSDDNKQGYRAFRHQDNTLYFECPDNIEYGFPMSYIQSKMWAINPNLSEESYAETLNQVLMPYVSRDCKLIMEKLFSSSQ